jgi:hypothetical protein
MVVFFMNIILESASQIFDLEQVQPVVESQLTLNQQVYDLLQLLCMYALDCNDHPGTTLLNSEFVQSWTNADLPFVRPVLQPGQLLFLMNFSHPPPYTLAYAMYIATCRLHDANQFLVEHHQAVDRHQRRLIDAYVRLDQSLAEFHA